VSAEAEIFLFFEVFVLTETKKRNFWTRRNLKENFLVPKLFTV
jgi:hypothetical protein